MRTQLLTIGNKLWENHDLTLHLVITYIYLCERVSASCLSFFFSNSPSVMDQKLNWNVTQALEKTLTIGILSYMDSWCIVPFSSNVSWDGTESLSLFWLREWEQCCVSFMKCHVSLAVGYTARIFLYESHRHTFIARNSNSRQSERAFPLKCNGQSTLCSSFLQKEMSQLQGIKTNWWGF